MASQEDSSHSDLKPEQGQASLQNGLLTPDPTPAPPDHQPQQSHVEPQNGPLPPISTTVPSEQQSAQSQEGSHDGPSQPVPATVPSEQLPVQSQIGPQNGPSLPASTTVPTEQQPAQSRVGPQNGPSPPTSTAAPLDQQSVHMGPQNGSSATNSNRKLAVPRSLRKRPRFENDNANSNAPVFSGSSSSWKPGYTENGHQIVGVKPRTVSLGKVKQEYPQKFYIRRRDQINQLEELDCALLSDHVVQGYMNLPDKVDIRTGKQNLTKLDQKSFVKWIGIVTSGPGSENRYEFTTALAQFGDGIKLANRTDWRCVFGSRNCDRSMENFFVENGLEVPFIKRIGYGKATPIKMEGSQQPAPETTNRINNLEKQIGSVLNSVGSTDIKDAEFERKIQLMDQRLSQMDERMNHIDQKVDDHLSKIQSMMNDHMRKIQGMIEGLKTQ